MSNLHRLFKELEKLEPRDRYFLYEALNEADSCKERCKELGVKFTYKKLAKFIFQRKNKNGLQPAPAAAPMQGPTLKQIEQIIVGTNLDIIEEAAKKKGLI